MKVLLKGIMTEQQKFEKVAIYVAYDTLEKRILNKNLLIDSPFVYLIMRSVSKEVAASVVEVEKLLSVHGFLCLLLNLLLSTSTWTDCWPHNAAVVVAVLIERLVVLHYLVHGCSLWLWRVVGSVH